MNMISIALLLGCAAGTLLLMWQIARQASRLMCREAPDLPALRYLSDALPGVEKTWTSPDGLAFRSWHRGSGEPIVILPEWGLHPSAYSPLWHFLCGYGFQVISLEYNPRRQPRDLMGLSQDLDQLCQSLRVRKPHVLGHGFGAYLALYHQQFLPGRLEASSVWGLSAFAGGPIRDTHLPWLARWFPATTSYEASLRSFAGLPSAATLKAYRKLQAQPGLPLVNHLPRLDDLKTLDRVQAPVTLIASPHDERVPPMHSRRLASICPNAETIWMRGRAGHMLIWEQPDQLAELLHRAATAARMPGCRGA